MDNAAFMTVWGAYQHCQAGTDVDVMRADMQQLARTASAQKSADTAPLPLPDLLKRVVARPVTRLAVDPRAMAAACALSTGQAAVRAERMEVALEMFQAVLRNYPQPEYAYYADQARTGLAHVEHALSLPDMLAARPRS